MLIFCFFNHSFLQKWLFFPRRRHLYLPLTVKSCLVSSHFCLPTEKTQTSGAYSRPQALSGTRLLPCCWPCCIMVPDPVGKAPGPTPGTRRCSPGRQAGSITICHDRQKPHDRNHTSLVPACFSVLIKVLNDYGWVKRPFLKEGVEVTDWILPPMPSIKPGVPETVAHLPCSTALLFLASESSTLRIMLWSAK